MSKPLLAGDPFSGAEGPVLGIHEASLLFGVVGGLITDWDSGTWLRLRGCKGLGNAIPFNLRVDKIETRHRARLYNTIQYNMSGPPLIVSSPPFEWEIKPFQKLSFKGDKAR